MRRTKKELEEIKSSIKDLKDVLVTNSQEKELELEKIKEQIPKIDLKISEIKIDLLPSGEEVLYINYNTQAIVFFNESGEPLFNEKFYAINYLDLLKNKDVKTIYKFLEKMKYKKSSKNS